MKRSIVSRSHCMMEVRRRPCGNLFPLRTARVVVAHLQDGNALIQMFRAVVSSESAIYDSLIGQSFEDDFIQNGPRDRVDDSQAGKTQSAD